MPNRTWQWGGAADYYHRSMKHLLVLVVPLLLTSVGRAQDLPDGKGKDLAERICGGCHGTDIVAANKGDRKMWEGLVEDMYAKGATSTDAEKTQLIDYLAAYLGAAKVNVNKATAKELADGLEISAKEADAIVKYRQDKGDFKAWADLAKVAGVDQKKLESKKDKVSF
jgi:competence protein ComEA